MRWNAGSAYLHVRELKELLVFFCHVLPILPSASNWRVCSGYRRPLVSAAAVRLGLCYEMVRSGRIRWGSTWLAQMDDQNAPSVEKLYTRRTNRHAESLARQPTNQPENQYNTTCTSTTPTGQGGCPRCAHIALTGTLVLNVKSESQIQSDWLLEGE